MRRFILLLFCMDRCRNTISSVRKHISEAVYAFPSYLKRWIVFRLENAAATAFLWISHQIKSIFIASILINFGCYHQIK